MTSSSLSYPASTIKFEFLNWVASDPMLRDASQSDRLHEPEFRINTIDPITGEDIKDVKSHPHLTDGNLTIYFETEATKKAYREQPIDHPNARLPYAASDEDDRGG